MTHKLHDLVVIAVLAVVCGADGWAQVVQFGRGQATWLATFLDLPGGIPSHDTFGRVFARLDPDAFERCFTAWMAALVELAGGRLVAIDGKAVRRSFAARLGPERHGPPGQRVRLPGGNRLVFAQVAVEGKANEIAAIPKLLALLDLARGGRDDRRDRVPAGGGRGRRGRRRRLPAAGEGQPARCTPRSGPCCWTTVALDAGAGPPVDCHEQSDDGHGRLERREAWVVDDTHWLGKALLAQWPGLASGQPDVVRRTRQDLSDLTGKVTVERQLLHQQPGRATTPRPRLAGRARGHWAVENNLHWQLDVSFDEDRRRVRVGHGAENFSRLCRVALNLLKQDKTVKAGIKAKRLKAGWDHDYLLQLISGEDAIALPPPGAVPHSGHRPGEPRRS